MFWYSHLLKNFPQFIVIHTVKVFGIVNKAEIDVFLELSCFVSLGRYIPKYFILFTAMVNGIVSLISLSIFIVNSSQMEIGNFTWSFLFVSYLMLKFHSSESESHSVMSDSLQPHWLFSVRFLCPWDSPGKNTGASRHFLL